MRKLLLGALVLAGCHFDAPTQPAPAAPQQPRAVVEGTFTDGTPLNLEALAGKPYVVNVFLPG